MMMTKRSPTPHSKKVIQHYETIIEEKDTLFKNVETIVGIAENQIQILNKKYQASLSKPEALSAFLTKIVSLLNATNYLVFEFLETERPPFSSESDNRDSKEYSLYGSIDKLQGPVNKSCPSIPHHDSNNEINFDGRKISTTSDVTSNLAAIENGRSSSAPTLCSNESNISTVSTYAQVKRENFSEKMGFTDFHGEELSKANGHQSPMGSSKIIELQDELPKIPEPNFLLEKENIPLPNSLNGPSRSTGAIRKYTSAPESSTDSSCIVTKSLGRDKVTDWLENKTGVTEEHDNVLKKLNQVKRYDREQEAKESMPNIGFVPYVPPRVESDGSSSGKSRKKNSKPRKLNKDFEIPAMELPTEGSTCIFSHIVSPQEFYLQIIHPTSTKNLDLIYEHLNEAGQAKKAFMSKQEAQAVLGKYCSGYFFYKNNFREWYRLKILDWKLETVNDQVIVQSIDYGFTCNISYKCLRKLTLDLAKIPKCAIKCHFPWIYPIGSTPTNLLSDWSKSAIDTMYDMANLSKDPLDAVTIEDLQLFEITFACQIEDSLGVDLVRVPADGGDSMGSELIEMGLAKEIIDTGDDPYLTEMLQDVEELEAADDPNEYILGYNARDEARVCKFTRPDGTCFKGRNCKLDHVQLKDGYTTDKSPTYANTLRDLILPKKFEEVEVLVTGYIDSCTYIVQMIRNRAILENNVSANAIVDKDLADLMRNMNDPKIIGTYVPFKMLPAIGELILAYNPILKKWKRAVVRDFEELDPVFVEVSPIDFGGDFRTSIKNIRKIKEEFVHVPSQTFQIYLDNYQHKKTCDNLKANQFFEKHIFYKSFIARILTYELPFKVKLMTMKGTEIGLTLVKEGFAEPRTRDCYLSDDRSVRGPLILD